MKPPIEVLFESCHELFGKDHIYSLHDFQEECKKDKVMGEGVNAICIAMRKYTDMSLQETIDAWKKDHDQLQVNRLVVERQFIALKEYVKQLEAELVELKKDAVIVE